MKAGQFADMLASVLPETLSPGQREKNAAVMIARRVAREPQGLGAAEAAVLGRQLLRALALPECE